MRHRTRDKKLGRSSAHRDMAISATVCNLVKRGRVKTTISKARQARSMAEKMVTIARKGNIHARRLLVSRLRDKGCSAKLVDEIAPRFAERNGGYTRILKLGSRMSDGSEMVLLEWTESAPLSEPSSTAPLESGK
ncbi:MAG: 50S ribosomal protein L17 [Verrucomicrobiota bacterium]